MAARERALRILSNDDKAAADEDIEISEDVRKKYGQKLVIYGSTQTHSIGAKVRQPMPHPIAADSYPLFQGCYSFGPSFPSGASDCRRPVCSQRRCSASSN